MCTKNKLIPCVKKCEKLKCWSKDHHQDNTRGNSCGMFLALTESCMWGMCNLSLNLSRGDSEDFTDFYNRQQVAALSFRRQVNQVDQILQTGAAENIPSYRKLWFWVFQERRHQGLHWRKYDLKHMKKSDLILPHYTVCPNHSRKTSKNR